MKHLESYTSKMKLNKDRTISDKQLKTMEIKSKAFNDMLSIITSGQDDHSDPNFMSDKYYDIKSVIMSSLEDIDRIKSMFKKEIE